jgi:hypothetical protein
MGRKVQNRRELRKQYEASEQVDPVENDDFDSETDDDDDDEATTTTRKKKAVKAPRTPKPKAVKPAARKKIIWVVLNDSFKPIAQFEFNQKDEADKKAQEMIEKGKGNHFVQKQKVEISADAPGLGAVIPRPEIVELSDVHSMDTDDISESEDEDDSEDDYSDSDDD